MQSTAAYPNFARVGAKLSVQEAKERRLARAAWAGDLHQLARSDAEAQVFEDRALAEGFGDRDELDRGFNGDRAVRREAAAARPVLFGPYVLTGSYVLTVSERA